MDNKFEILNEILDLFLTEYHYIPPVSSETSHPVHKDEMFNYFNQIMFYINNIIDTFYQIFAQHGMIIK
jgi:hypothetical protein